MSFLEKNARISQKSGVLFLFCLLVFATTLSACGTFSRRPKAQMSYAISAFRAAHAAGAAETAPKEYKEARETLKRAKAAYRLKNFKDAQIFSLRARYLAEVAEFKAVRIAAGGTGNEKVEF